MNCHEIDSVTKLCQFIETLKHLFTCFRFTEGHSNKRYISSLLCLFLSHFPSLFFLCLSNTLCHLPFPIKWQEKSCLLRNKTSEVESAGQVIFLSWKFKKSLKIWKNICRFSFSRGLYFWVKFIQTTVLTKLYYKTPDLCWSDKFLKIIALDPLSFNFIIFHFIHLSISLIVLSAGLPPVQLIDRLSKNREEEEEEGNTITFSLKCIVIA